MSPVYIIFLNVKLLEANNYMQSFSIVSNEEKNDETSVNHFEIASGEEVNNRTIGSQFNFWPDDIDYNLIIRNLEDYGKIFCLIIAGIVVVTVVLSTAFSSCSTIHLANRTNDYVPFVGTTPYGVKAKPNQLKPYGSTDIKLGGNNHADVYTLNKGKFHFSDYGKEAKITDGPSNRKIVKSNPFIIFYTCNFEYKKGISTQTNNLRGSLSQDEISVDLEEPTLNI